MLSAPVLLPRPRRIEAGTLTCGNSIRHPGEPRALTFHYIFHYISHPFSWWQLVPWLLRRGDALHSVHPILSDTHTSVPTARRTSSHWIHCFLHWLTPDYCFLFTSRKVTSQTGGHEGVMTAMTCRFDPLLDPWIQWMIMNRTIKSIILLVPKNQKPCLHSHWTQPAKMGSVFFSLKSHCYCTQFKRFNPPCNKTTEKIE